VTFGELIRNARERRRLGPADLARALWPGEFDNHGQPVGRYRISRWESGERTPGVEDLLRIAEVLKVDVRELLPKSNGVRMRIRDGVAHLTMPLEEALPMLAFMSVMDHRTNGRATLK
jgi:transcriptional regulator with XRE-family HTH domain